MLVWRKAGIAEDLRFDDPPRGRLDGHGRPQLREAVAGGAHPDFENPRGNGTAQSINGKAPCTAHCWPDPSMSRPTRIAGRIVRIDVCVV